MQEVIVSGIKPTGSPHLGNYLGAFRQWLSLAASGRTCYFFIADYHALTAEQPHPDPDALRSQTIELGRILLALGLGQTPKVTLFAQSQVQGHADLAWIFNCLTSVGNLERMTQYKDKTLNRNIQSLKKVQELLSAKNVQLGDIAKLPPGELSAIREFLIEPNQIHTEGYFEMNQQDFVNAGLLDYPVLQAADILAYKGTLVPVGEDQVQHVELTRDIARTFNRSYGETFPETKPLLTKTLRVMSLKDPAKKMSKSLGDTVLLTDEPEVIARKFKSAVTATTGGDKSSGVENLFLLLEAFADGKTYKKFLAAEKDGSIRYAELKGALATAVAEHFAEFRKRHEEITPNEVRTVLAEGAAKAQTVADRTLGEVRKKVGLLALR